MKPSDAGEIGYVLKSYPRMSETFIANEIYLLEQLGLKLRLYSLLDLSDPQRHAVVEATRAPLRYLPQVSSLSETSFPNWLKLNWPKFADSHQELFKAQPWRYVQTQLFALWLAFKHPKGAWWQPQTSFFKEFLQAGYIAQQVLAVGTIRHLHAHFCHSATTVAMFASQLSGLPFSFTAHAKDIYVQALNPGDLLPTKLRRAEFAVTCTQANATHLAGLGVRETPIHRIYHGLDTKQFAPRPAASVATSAEAAAVPLVLTVGRMVEKKGFPTLIRACRLLKDQGVRFRCQMVCGNGPVTEQVADLIKELDLTDTVTMQPAVTQEALQAIYQQAALFVLPCQIADNDDRDGIPNVLVEAMAVGLPVVSTNVSGIPELIEHQVSGWLVPQKDAQALAAAIAELLADAALRQRLGQVARAQVCRLFDAEANVRTLYQLLHARLGAAESVKEARLRERSLAQR